MEAVNASFASPSADAQFAPELRGTPIAGVLGRVLEGVNAWSVIVTLFAMLVVYDQSACFPRPPACAPADD